MEWIIESLYLLFRVLFAATLLTSFGVFIKVILDLWKKPNDKINKGDFRR